MVNDRPVTGIINCVLNNLSSPARICLVMDMGLLGSIETDIQLGTATYYIVHQVVFWLGVTIIMQWVLTVHVVG